MSKTLLLAKPRAHAPRSVASCTLVVAALLTLAACGPTLVRGAKGWQESSSPYAIAPTEGGSLLESGWLLEDYTAKDGGFRRENYEPLPDLGFRRIEDDGRMLIVSETMEEADIAKLPQVFVDRWVARFVQKPDANDRQTDLYAPVLPVLETTITGSVGFTGTTATRIDGRSVQPEHQATFASPGTVGAEMIATLAPSGAQADRKLYLAIVKQTGGDRFVVVAYGNSPAMFDRGLADASSFARRIRF
jgi:hypothetical protein